MKGFYVEDKSTRKVYFFNCNAWIGRDADKQDIKCEGYTLPEGKHGEFSLGYAFVKLTLNANETNAKILSFSLGRLDSQC